ncbi:unnamed protein product [Phytophthora fragariaefolia]|uniref:Unnamed protein product n=1 Tax=Phytophthora fragariaefolia TaxID=1490495 RepID=A0A9W7D6I4_9STRA|nr:unnamed protein product [Phytophthora fragariaefolia]
MVAPVGKTPRHTLTPEEKKKCLEVLRRERRVCRAEEKEARAGAAAGAPQKKAAAKATAAAVNNASAEAKQTAAEAKTDAEEATTAAAVEIAAAEEEWVAPAEAKAPGKAQKVPTRKKAPDETPAMWRSGSAPATPAAVVVDAASAALPSAAVADEVVGTVPSIVERTAEEATPVEGATPSGSPDAVTSSTRPSTKPPSSGKRKRVETAESKKRRRGILQDDSADDEGDDDEGVNSSDDASARAGADGAGASVAVSLDCIVDGVPNLMDDGAAACTVLDSDEDPDLHEEPADEEDADDDSWDGDWDIGLLTDEESKGEPEELPESACSSAAKDSKYITAMRDIGWEYDESKFGPDPTYADLYDGPYGPTTSVLEADEDPLALLFYFMPPKLWAQIAVECNTYHRQ